jgi:hypothetical protein
MYRNYCQCGVSAVWCRNGPYRGGSVVIKWKQVTEKCAFVRRVLKKMKKYFRNVSKIQKIWGGKKNQQMNRTSACGIEYIYIYI